MRFDLRSLVRAASTGISGLLTLAFAGIAVHDGAVREPSGCLVASLATAFFLAAALRRPQY